MKFRIKFFEKFLSCNQYDIVHLNAGTGDIFFYAYIIKKIQPKTKIIIHCHGDNIEPPQKFLKLMFHYLGKNIFYHTPDVCLGVSQKTLDWMFSKKSITNSQSHILNCGIDSERFLFNNDRRIQIRKKLKIENSFVVGTIGRFTPQKNPQYILLIIEKLIKINSNFKFLWVGDGKLFNSIKEKAKNMKIDEYIIFYGISDEISDLLSAMDVFILPSIFEGNPLIGFEAQANGLHCLFSNKITKESKIINEVEFLSIEENPDVWAQTINKYVNSYNRLDRRSEIIKSGHDLEHCAMKLKDIYDKLLNEE